MDYLNKIFKWISTKLYFSSDLGHAKHKLQDQKKPAGSLLFCSPDTHLGRNYNQTENDDLYSLVYTMVYLSGKTLPAENTITAKLRKVKRDHKRFLVNMSVEKESPW